MKLQLRCTTKVCLSDSPLSGANAGALTHRVTNILLTQPDSLVPLCPPALQALEISGLNIPAPRRRGQVEGGQARLRLFPAALTHRGNPLSASVSLSLSLSRRSEWPSSLGGFASHRHSFSHFTASPFPRPAPSAAPKLDFPHVLTAEGASSCV